MTRVVPISTRMRRSVAPRGVASAGGTKPMLHWLRMILISKSGCFGVLTALGGAMPAIVVAADYLSVADAQRALFPKADRFVEVALSLTPAQHAQVAALAGPQPPHRSLRAFQARAADAVLGYAFVDEVIGREDFITYAVSIDATGTLGPLEV